MGFPHLKAQPKAFRILGTNVIKGLFRFAYFNQAPTSQVNFVFGVSLVYSANISWTTATSQAVIKSWITWVPTLEKLTILNGNVKTQIKCKVGMKPGKPRPLLNVAVLDVGKGVVLAFWGSQVTAGKTVRFEMSREPSLSWFLDWDGVVSICILKSGRSSHL